MTYQVSLIRAQSYEIESLFTQLESLLAPLGGIARLVQPGDRVLLKPNLLTGNRQGRECITRPEIVYCVAKMVQQAGGKPFIGDSPAFGTARGVIKANGYLSLIESLDLPVVEFHGANYEAVGDNFSNLRLSQEAMGADVVINLPKLKSHTQLTLTMGVKNLFGCVPGKMKAWWHMEAGKDAQRFAEMLITTARTINPDLTIIDGIIGHQGNGPSGGEPRRLEILGASTDVFALDWCLAVLLGVSPELVPTLVAQARMGLGADLEAMDFPLLTPEALAVTDWRLPDQLMPIDFGLPRVIRSGFKHLYIRWIREAFDAS